MNKIISTVFAVALVIPAFAFAATNVNLTAARQNVTAGQSFTVAINVAPSGDTVYTSKVALSYPADLVTLTSFTFASNVMALSQPGYDSVDNSAGSAIKTAGYTGGITAPAAFGTATFVAKSTGVATIAVTNSSAIYNQNNQNVFGGAESPVQISIANAPVAAPVSAETTPTVTTTGTDSTTPSATTNADQLAAAAAEASASGNGWTYSFIAIVVLAAAAWAWNMTKGRKTLRRKF